MRNAIPARRDCIIVTCEHGGNRIPARYRTLFNESRRILDSHRGFDAGALVFGRELAGAMHAPFFSATVSRLLIDLNRSLGHPGNFSEFTRTLPQEQRDEIIRRHYLPYRGEAESAIMQAIAGGNRVIHFSSHSFTPELDGEVRNADVGLLYDPAREDESRLCHAWQQALKAHAPSMKVRFNYPYRGKSDGFTSSLRRRLPRQSYLGIEIEINQRHVNAGQRHWHALRKALIAALLDVPLSNATASRC